MIYTIGHTENYLRYAEECRRNGELFGKLGRDGEPGYEGGSVWKTFEEARQHAQPGFSVFGVLADWDRDTAPNRDAGKPWCTWRDLVTTSPLVIFMKVPLNEILQQATPRPWDVVVGTDGAALFNPDIGTVASFDTAMQAFKENAALLSHSAQHLPLVIAAAERALNYLTSYPGGGADAAYEQLRGALDAARSVDVPDLVTPATIS